MSFLALGEFIESHGGLIQTGPFGSQLHQHEYQDIGVPVVMPKDIKEGRIDEDSVARVSEQKASELSRHRLKRNSIIFPRRGEINKCALITENEEGFLCGTGCLKIELPTDVLDPSFVFHYLGLRQSIEWLEKNAVGTTMLNLNTKILGRMPIPRMEISKQKAIADILSSYDDLIENNRRRMALLEESARLLYREWFVHLRFPGHEHVPVKDGVPEGWERKGLAEVAEFRLGKMLDQKKNRGELMPYLANVNVRWGKFELSDLREMRFEEDELEAYGLRFGDIVMCEGGEPGRCAIWTEQMPRMMIQKAIHRIRCRENVNHLFLYHSLRHLGQSGYLASLFTGATIKHLPREQLAKVSLLLPPRSLMDVFVGQLEPVETQLSLLATANRRASSARDLLLPRLMNGEIAV